MVLQIGEYDIPEDCRAMVYAGKVYVFKRLISGRQKGKKLHCKDCANRKLGYACFASHQKTMICTQRPKPAYRNNKRLCYAASKYGTICSKYKPLKEDTE